MQAVTTLAHGDLRLVPADQRTMFTGERSTMRCVMLMYDTLCRHLLPPYGNDWTRCPNFTRLATRCATFDNAYVGSMPCMPARRDLHTGRYNFLHRSWGPLEPFDDSVPELLREHGIYTHLVTDHYHYWEDGGATYHQRYSSFDLVRGQECDPWKAIVDFTPPQDPVGNRSEARGWRNHHMNRRFQTREEEMPQHQTFAGGFDFLERNRDADHWFLQVETFDPHEPFFAQKFWRDLYPGAEGAPDWPPYDRVRQDERIVHGMRMQYAALLSMCDHYLGRMLDYFDQHDLWRNTMLIVCTDHGFLLSEHDWWGKCRMPFFQEVAHIPLFIHDPRHPTPGARRQSLVQLIDVSATLLDCFGVERPAAMQGSPLAATVAADVPVRDAVLFGIHGGQVNVTDGRHVYMRGPACPDNTPLDEYTLMPTHMNCRFSPAEFAGTALVGPLSFTKGCPVLRIPGRGARWLEDQRTTLWDLRTDYAQRTPLRDPRVEERMIGHLRRLMAWNDAPAAQYERLGL
jgi:arylsulfatase A-like enzyme